MYFSKREFTLRAAVLKITASFSKGSKINPKKHFQDQDQSSNSNNNMEENDEEEKEPINIELTSKK